MPSIVLECLLELIAQFSRGLSNAVRADDLAIQVREGSTDNDSDSGNGDKHHSIHGRVDEVWKYIINVEDDGDGTVENSDASLMTGSVLSRLFECERVIPR